MLRLISGPYRIGPAVDGADLKAGSWRTDPLLRVRQILALVGIGAAAAILAVECWQYLSLGGYVDHIEASVVIIGWRYLHGLHLYEMRGGLPLFATFYGPLTYLAALPGLLAFGGSVLASKLASMMALLATLGMMAAYFVRHPAKGEARHGMGLLVAGLLLFSPVAFWVRPDPIETLLVALGVTTGFARWRAVWLGVCIGLSVNFKIHAFIYFLPILVDLWWCRGARALMIAAAVSAAIFSVPFLAPGISLGTYVCLLAHQAGGRAPALSELPSTLIFVAPLLALVILPLLAQPQSARSIVYCAATLASAALLLYPATIPGAGVYHFLPLVPVLADVRHRLRPAGRATDLAPLALLFFACFPAMTTFRALARKSDAAQIAAEALSLAQRSPVAGIEVGYGDSQQSYERDQVARVVLALHSYPVAVDAQVLMELRQVGADGSARWIPYLDQCRIRRWLLPIGETPFALKNFYYGGGALFDDAFRQAFFDNYRRIGDTRHFEVWDCARRRW